MEGTDAPLGTRDALGYSAAYWHKFSIGYGIADVTNNRGDYGTLKDLLFEAKLVAMPGFLLPGRFSVNFHQGNFTEARLRTSFADGWLKDVDLWFGSDLVGHYRQNYAGTPGSARWIGRDARCQRRHEVRRSVAAQPARSVRDLPFSRAFRKALVRPW